MMSQEWVTKLMHATTEDATVVGREPADDDRDAWTLRFIAKLVSVGLPINFALELYSGGEHDFTIGPEEAAQEELDAMQ